MSKVIFFTYLVFCQNSYIPSNLWDISANVKQFFGLFASHSFTDFTTKVETVSFPKMAGYKIKYHAHLDQYGDKSGGKLHI